MGKQDGHLKACNSESRVDSALALVNVNNIPSRHFHSQYLVICTLGALGA